MNWALEIDFRSNDVVNGTIPVVARTIVSNGSLMKMVVAVVGAVMALSAAAAAVVRLELMVAANGFVLSTMLLSMSAISLILIYYCRYSICSFHCHFE